MERLFSMLPYKSLSFSTLEGRHGIYALINKNEKKHQDEKVSPSVRAQLRTKMPKSPEKDSKIKTSRNGGMT